MFVFFMLCVLTIPLHIKSSYFYIIKGISVKQDRIEVLHVISLHVVMLVVDVKSMHSLAESFFYHAHPKLKLICSVQLSALQVL